MSLTINTLDFANLSDRDLSLLNELLPWNCFTEDIHGRKLGRQAWQGKRSEKQEIPDQRITKLNALMSLEGKTVLEVGCFEGVHTIGLLSYNASVVAIDARIENVVKTMARCAAYGVSPKVFVLDVDDRVQTSSLPEFEILHHVGVLYHLFDPVIHLNFILPKISSCILLDTHYATEETATHYHLDGYKYMEYKELGYKDVFSGMSASSKWLTKTHIYSLLEAHGFTSIQLLSDKMERNGPRISLIASKNI